MDLMARPWAKIGRRAGAQHAGSPRTLLRHGPGHQPRIAPGLARQVLKRAPDRLETAAQTRGVDAVIGQRRGRRGAEIQRTARIDIEEADARLGPGAFSGAAAAMAANKTDAPARIEQRKARAAFDL